MLNWANQFNICCFLDNHNYNITPHTYECILAVGADYLLEARAADAFQQLQNFSDQHADWLFGHFGYDLKNEIEKLHSKNPDRIEFPDLLFFVPKVVLRLEKDKISIGSHSMNVDSVFRNIQEISITSIRDSLSKSIDIQSRFTKQEYLDTIEELKEHIHRGDCYEINFCQEFFAENVSINPLSVYRHLVNVSPNPFSGYYKWNDRYLMCASPERYLKKTGTQLLSQPIKGTSEREEDMEADELSRAALSASVKEELKM